MLERLVKTLEEKCFENDNTPMVKQNTEMPPPKRHFSLKDFMFTAGAY